MTSGGNEMLMNGGGTRWAKFPTIGTTVRGKVVGEPVCQQQREYGDPTQLATWDDGNPKMEIVVRMLTDQRDPEFPDDDGMRALHIAEKSALHAAVRKAVTDADAKGIHEGGELSVTYVGDGEAKGRFSAPKQYSAEYTKPMFAGSAGNQSLMATTPAAGGGGADAPAVGLPRPAAVDEAQWRGMSPEQQRAVAAALQRSSQMAEAPF